MSKAFYRWIPCYFDEVTMELVGRNKFYDILVDINLWFDLKILQLDELPVWMEVDDDETK